MLCLFKAFNYGGLHYLVRIFLYPVFLTIMDFSLSYYFHIHYWVTQNETQKLFWFITCLLHFLQYLKKNEYALLSQNEKKPSLHLITKVYLLMVIELEIWRIDSIHSKWSLFCVYLSLNYYIKFCCLIYINATFNQFI